MQQEFIRHPERSACPSRTEAKALKTEKTASNQPQGTAYHGHRRELKRKEIEKNEKEAMKNARKSERELNK